MPDPLLTRKTLVLAEIETVYNVDPTPDPTTDALLVTEPDYQIDPNVLERDNVRADLSPDGIAIGRKLASMTFTHELRSNGLTDSGLVADAAKLGRLFRACGFSETGIQGGSGANLGPMKEITAAVPGQVAWATPAGTYADDQLANYTITCSLGGASATAEVDIDPDQETLDQSYDTAQTGVVLTSGVALPLTAAGGGEISIIPTWTGNLTVGDQWRIVVYPDGILYEPVSESFDSLTLYMYMDGTLHILTGAFGTFTINAEAGAFGTVEFEFTGQYVAPTDVALPTNEILEITKPPIVELSRMRLDDFDPYVNAWSFDMNNEIVPRPSVNHSDGYDGVRISGRAPEMGADPEATLVATEDFWGKFAASTDNQITARVGQAAGETMWLYAPKFQYNGLTYADRDGSRTYDAGLRLARFTGDDEVALHFS